MNNKADRFKIANPYEHYGQYGHDHREDDSGTNTALMLGAGALGAGALHHGLMNTRGKLLGGGFVNAYQNGVGGQIRGAANKLRGAVGMDPVAQPDAPIVGLAKEMVNKVPKNVEEIKAAVKPVMQVGGAVKALHGLHNQAMSSEAPGMNAYRAVIGQPLEKGVAAAKKGVGQAADWAVKKTAPKPRPEVTPSEPTPSVSPDLQEKMRQSESKAKLKAQVQPRIRRTIKKSSVIYEAGSEAAFATYDL